MMNYTDDLKQYYNEVWSVKYPESAAYESADPEYLEAIGRTAGFASYRLSIALKEFAIPIKQFSDNLTEYIINLPKMIMKKLTIQQNNHQVLRSGVYWYDRKIDVTYIYDENNRYLVVDHTTRGGYFSVPSDEVTDQPRERVDIQTGDEPEYPILRN